MKKKIIVITTGGTIGSILSSSSISIDTSEKRISQEIHSAKKRLGYTVDVLSPLNKNSESLYPSDWIKILQAIDDANKTDADGIVVTHGTDTMAYSVAAAVAYNDYWDKKICFTGAYYSPDHPLSDTSLSLLTALEFTASPHPANGIYVAFRSNRFNSEAKIINGASIKPMNFDDCFFESVYGDFVSTFNPNEGLSDEISLNSTNAPYLGVSIIPTENDILRAQSEIACIFLYPGIDINFLEAAVKGRKFLIIQMYHSGTGPSDINNHDLIDFIQAQSNSVTVLMGTFPKKHIDLPYDSTIDLKNAGAHVYSDMQQHSLYVFSILSLALGFSKDEVLKKLSHWEI